MVRCRVRLIACLFFVAVDAQRFESSCGTAVGRVTPTIVHGVTTTNITFPWHVGVYWRTWDGTYGHICGGTLISSDLVISAAHCFYDETRGQVEDARKFKIAAGKYYRAYDSPNDTYVQKSSVKSIDIPEKYIGYSGNYAADIALVRVETPFSTTALVKPVCVHWDIIDGIEHPLSGRIGKVVGWGVTETTEPSEVLKEISLPFIPYDNCSAASPVDFRNFLTPEDKFCAGYLNGSSVCAGDSGGGLCFEHRGLWYLRGIVSNIPRGTNDLGCDNNQYALFTNVHSSLKWIHPAFDGTRIATNGCTLPNQPKSGSFKLTCHGECDGVPGSVVPRGSVLVYRCEQEHILKGNAVLRCGISGWNSLPTCIKACPPLPLSNPNIVCELGDQRVSCGSLIPPDTIGSLACPNFHKISGTYNSTYDQMTCLGGGEWDRPVPQCVPECGKIVDSVDLFSGTDSEMSHHAGLPWEVEIHYLGSSQLIVGNIIQGTLIQPGLVLTAFSKQFFLADNGQRRDLDDYEASAGHVRNLNTTKDFWVQKSKIVAFNYKEPMEDGDELSRIQYGTVGLVLLRLATPFKMTTYVRPVCIDWDDEFTVEQLRMGNVGKVPKTFFGTNETSVDGESGIDFTYMPREHCRRLFDESYKFVFTSATFCAHTVTEATNKDSSDGLGIGFEFEGLWYLRGLIGGHFPRSAFLNASNRTYALFINIGNFREWIRAAYGDESGCILPQQHKDGKFELHSCQEACNTDPGSRVPTGSVLVHRCNEGWWLEGRDTSKCGHKEWDTFPKCSKQCSTLASSGVSMTCKYEGQRSPCGSQILPGTTASLACKDFYKISGSRNSTNYEITCLDGGEWDGPPLYCVPECGKLVDPKDQFRDASKGKYHHAELPWAVLVSHHVFFGRSFCGLPISSTARMGRPPQYLEKSDSNFIVGTLIQPDLVLSVFDKKFFLDHTEQPRNIKKFRVTAGRYYDGNKAEYFYQQVSNIESFKYVNVTELQRADRNVIGFMLLWLVVPFEMTIRVRPACVDWDNRLVTKHLRKGNVGKVPKIFFGTKETVNGESSTDFTYLSREEQQHLIPEELESFPTTVEFCAHTLNTTTNIRGNDSVYSGLGISFESEGLWYLRGLLSGHIPSAAFPSTSNRTYVTFINVGKFVGRIRAAYRDGSIVTRDRSGCIMPEWYNGGRSDLDSCSEVRRTDPGSRVPTGSRLFHQCYCGYRLEGNIYSECVNNEWDSLPRCIKYCAYILHLSVVMTSKDGVYNTFPCDSYFAPGATASLSCRKFYKISSPRNSTNSEVTCLDGGEWDRPPPFQCVPECGQIVTHAGKSQHAELPWAVTILYETFEERNGGFIEGTLIQPDLVLSVWKEEFFLGNTGQHRHFWDFTVSAGSHYDLNTAEYSAKRVKNIESFNAMDDDELQRIDRHMTKLVLLRLVKPFVLSIYIRPICVDWDNRLVTEQLIEGNVGKVPKTHFGTNETSTKGESGIDYTYLPHEDCLRLLRKEKQNSVTTAELCGHTFTTTTNASNDDSVLTGLGISFKSGDRWYLRGVLRGYFAREDLLSASNRTYALFINVGNFVGWIRAAIGNESIYMTLPEQYEDEKDVRRAGSHEMTDNCTKCDSTTEFECNNNRCVPKPWLCDFNDDCGDGSDEAEAICEGKYRECSESEFRCSNGKCIASMKRCDHEDDCGDGSDESNRTVCVTTGRSCDSNIEYSCANKKCIEKSKLCNIVDDCGDFSDELACPKLLLQSPCKNGGVYRKNDEGELECACPIEFHGEHCEIGLVAESNEGNIAAIVISVVVAILLLLGAAVVFVFRKKLPIGKFGGLGRPTGTRSMSFPQGSNVASACVAPDGMELLDVEYNLNDMNNKNRGLSTPMYDSVNSEQTGATNCTSTSEIYEVPAGMNPSSLQRNEAPHSHLKRRELDPTPVNSGENNQQLVEEDQSDCKL